MLLLHTDTGKLFTMSSDCFALSGYENKVDLWNNTENFIKLYQLKSNAICTYFSPFCNPGEKDHHYLWWYISLLMHPITASGRRAKLHKIAQNSAVLRKPHDLSLLRVHHPNIIYMVPFLGYVLLNGLLSFTLHSQSTSLYSSNIYIKSISESCPKD